MLETEKSTPASFDSTPAKPSVPKEFLLSIAAVALGLLSYPVGSPNVLNNGLATLGLAIVAIVVGLIAISGIWTAIAAAGAEAKAFLDPILLGGVALGILIGNVSYPWLTVTLAAVTIGLRSEVLLRSSRENGFTRVIFSAAIVGVALGAYGFGYFVHSRHNDLPVASALQAEKAAPAVALPSDAHTIDLKPYINVPLTESLFHNRLFDDSFSKLPRGNQTLGGIPFSVEGIVMLTGRLAVKYGSEYPSKVEVKIGSKCERLHFLGGVSQEDYQNYGAVVGDVTLKYTDGTQSSSKLVVGYNVVNRLGIPTETLDDVNSSIAWSGNNGLTDSFQKTMPFLKLRLCKTTIINPHPELEVASVVYESRQLAPSPFFAALTLD